MSATASERGRRLAAGGAERVRKLAASGDVQELVAKLKRSLPGKRSATPSVGSTNGAAAGADGGGRGAGADLQRFREKVRERPEIGVAGAFVGGLVLATILKRIVRR